MAPHYDPLRRHIPDQDANARPLPAHRRQSRLVAAGRPGEERAAGRNGSRRSSPTSPRCMGAARTCWWCPRARSRWGARSPRRRKGALKLDASQATAAIGQIALARSWAEALGGAWHPRRADAADPAGHRGAPPLPQRPRHAGAPRRDARGAGHQRKRHGGDQRNPLWRQRPPRRPRRRDGERRSPDPALGHRRPLHRAAQGRPAGRA